MSPILRLYVALLVSALAASALGQAYTFTHYAGTTGGKGFEDGVGRAARFGQVEGIGVDHDGNVYVADTWNDTIRKITPDGVVSTLAGVSTTFGGVDGRGGTARFYGPHALAVAGDGTLYVSCAADIRRISPEGDVSTVAGASGWQVGSNDGIGSKARFSSPQGIAVGADGTLYVADTNNSTIRKITPGGVVTTLAGLAGSHVTIDGTGSAARFQRPRGLDVDANGNIYVADGLTIRKVTSDGVVTTVAGKVGVPGTIDGTGSEARFQGPSDVAIDALGNIYITDRGTVRGMTPDGTVTTLAGSAGSQNDNDGPLGEAQFVDTSGIAVDDLGNLFVATYGTVRKIEAGIVTTLAGSSAVSGSADGACGEARFFLPSGLAIDEQDNIFVADLANNTIRKISPTCQVSTFAGSAGEWGLDDGTGTSARFADPSGLAIDGNGNLFVTDIQGFSIRKITPDGTVTTVGSAFLGQDIVNPRQLAIDSVGNIYFTEWGNHWIKKLDLSGTVTAFAGVQYPPGSDDGTGDQARFSSPSGLAADQDGNIYVADSDNCTIRKITSERTVTTLAGSAQRCNTIDGVGADAWLTRPEGLDLDTLGNLYVAEFSAIRKVTPDGVVSTLGGGYLGASDGTSGAARFYYPRGVRLDSSGNLFIAEPSNQSIRKGSIALEDSAKIDANSGPVGVSRQLDTTAQTATQWRWEIVRRPSGSQAELSSTNIRNPTFTPDVADRFEFRLTASNASGSSITIVSLEAGATTTTTLDGTFTTSRCGDTATFTATVSSDVPGTVGGSVAFKNFGAWIGTAPVVDGVGSITLPLSPGSYSVTAELSGDAVYRGSQSGAVTHDVAPLDSPTGLDAVAVSSSEVDLSWTGNVCAEAWEVRRRSSTGSFFLVGTVSTPSFQDFGVLPATTYQYVVRAIVQESASSDSDIAIATTIVFTDDPVIAGTTRVKKLHLTELRTAVNAYRASAGLAPAVFTDPTLPATTPIKAVHILELRSALDAARSELGMPPISYTDPAITPGTTRVKAVHFRELRSGVE